MKQKEFENITNRMIEESALDSELLKDFTSYVVLNCDGLEEPTILFQKEVSLLLYDSAPTMTTIVCCSAFYLCA